MTTNLIKPSRIDFDKVDINQIQRILSTGTLEALAPFGLDGPPGVRRQSQFLLYAG